MQGVIKRAFRALFTSGMGCIWTLWIYPFGDLLVESVKICLYYNFLCIFSLYIVSSIHSKSMAGPRTQLGPVQRGKERRYSPGKIPAAFRAKHSFLPYHPTVHPAPAIQSTLIPSRLAGGRIALWRLCKILLTAGCRSQHFAFPAQLRSRRDSLGVWRFRGVRAFGWE